MTETDARAVLLMRSCERTALVGTDDAAWAGREARRQLGDAASGEAWLARRGRLALARLADQQPALRPALARVQAPDHSPAVLLFLAAAAGVGLLADGLGPARRINLLALPLLGLVAWNLVVCLLVLVQGLGRRLARAGVASGGAPVEPSAGVAALARLGAWLDRRRHRTVQLPASAVAALGAFTADWLAHSRPLQAARGAALLHVGAALLALGMVVALYARGLVFDYQAGWDSTFLQPAQVHAVLQGLLGPAAWLAGLPLPDAAGLAGLRLSAGGGESAAPWIHRWALTLLLLVVVPRALLAAWAWRQARSLAAHLPLPDDAGLQGLQQAESADATGGRPVAVLPYSYRLDPALQAAVAPALASWLGPGLRCDLQPSLPLGAEDQLPQWLPATLARLPAMPLTDARAAPPPVLVLLFALTATPERESHGAMVQAMVQALGALPAPRPQLLVAVDTSSYRQRLAGPDGTERLAQRRAAWEGLLLGLGVVPGFIDLAPAASRT